MPDDRSQDLDFLESTVGELDAELLGGPRTLSAHDLAERAGIDIDVVRGFWTTMGLPHADPDERVYTERDAEAIDRAAALVREHGLDLRTVITVTRALGHTSDRLALWQVEALVEDMAGRYELDDTSARLLVLDRLASLAPVLEAQLVHSYRRQLAAIAGRYAGEFGQLRDPGPDRSALPLARAVGFADMVSFTRRTAGLGSTDLSQFVQRFEAAARDIVSANGGRVVKTIGDAILFVADSAATGAAHRARPRRRAGQGARRRPRDHDRRAVRGRPRRDPRAGRARLGAGAVAVRRRLRARREPRRAAHRHRRPQHRARRRVDRRRCCRPTRGSCSSPARPGGSPGSGPWRRCLRPRA